MSDTRELLPVLLSEKSRKIKGSIYEHVPAVAGTFCIILQISYQLLQDSGGNTSCLSACSQ